jgi:hypothetical protein
MIGNKFKKYKFMIFAVIIAVLVILLSAFWIIPQIHPASTQPVTGSVSTITQSVGGYYLQYSPLLNYGFDSNVSRIFVVSANASYGVYPYDTRTAFGGSSIVVKNGEPCIIINVTILNDYSTQNITPAFNPQNSTSVQVCLTAQLFNGEKQIKTTDLLIVGLPANAPGANAWINYGENATISIYLATKNTDITSFQIVPRYIGMLPLA